MSTPVPPPSRMNPRYWIVAAVILVIATVAVVSAVLGWPSGSSPFSTSSATTPLGCAVERAADGVHNADIDIGCTEERLLARGCDTDVSGLPTPRTDRGFDGEIERIWTYGEVPVAMIRLHPVDGGPYPVDRVEIVSLENGCVAILDGAEWQALLRPGTSADLPSSLR